jgi:hypothetical protein
MRFLVDVVLWLVAYKILSGIIYVAVVATVPEDDLVASVTALSIFGGWAALLGWRVNVLMGKRKLDDQLEDDTGDQQRES